MKTDGHNPATATIDEDAFYPHSDGKPLGDSNQHFWSIVRIADAIRELMEDRLDEVSIHGDMFWYWEQGNRQAVRAPDVMVLFGVPHDEGRLSYRSWNHGNIAPGVIIESASQEQQSILLGELRDEYERLGVREYFIFDCTGACMPEQLIGFRLRGDRYQRMVPNDDGTLTSRQLGVILLPDGARLRLADLRTGEPIMTRAERTAAAERRIAAAEAKIEAAKAETEAKEQTIQRLMYRLKQAGITPPEAS